MSKFKLHPVSIKKYSQGTFVSRGFQTTKIEDSYNHDLIIRLEELLSVDNGSSLDDLKENFPSEDYPKVLRLIDVFLNKKIIYEVDSNLKRNNVPETANDLFNWSFSIDPERLNSLSNLKIYIITSFNAKILSSKIKEDLERSGFSNISILDFEVFKHNILSDNCKMPDYIIGTSMGGNIQQLLSINSIALINKINYLPLYINNLVGIIGPYVLSDQVPCLKCLKGRFNSCLTNFNDYEEYHNSTEEYNVAYNPLMINQISGLAAFELYKLHMKISNNLVGKILEINFMSGQTISRKLLKVPRCPDCSNVNKFPPNNWVNYKS
jgi:thiazole/oxazole-forming peptide maturase SagC family component